MFHAYMESGLVFAAEWRLIHRDHHNRATAPSQWAPHDHLGTIPNRFAERDYQAADRRKSYRHITSSGKNKLNLSCQRRCEN